jgi:GAF domain-containing protein
MEKSDPFDPTGALAELTRIVSEDREMSAILDDVVALARRRVPGADEVSVTLIRNEVASTVAATGQLAVDLDEVQYEQGYGPCLDAGRNDEVQLINDTATENRWKKYVIRARELGLGGSVSSPMPVENYLVGALNIYSRTPDAFDADAVHLARAFAAHVTAAVSHAESRRTHQERVVNLERAIHSHSVIDQAKGIIMVQQKCTSDAAFGMLRKLSMDENIKLYDLAAALVASASGHPLRPPSPEGRSGAANRR